MTIAAIREKLHEYIDVADDKRVEAIYAMVEDTLSENRLSKSNKMVFMQQASTDILLMADLKEIKDDFDFVDNEKYDH